MRKFAPPNQMLRLVEINGEPGFVTYVNGQPGSAIVLHTGDDRIQWIELTVAKTLGVVARVAARSRRLWPGRRLSDDRQAGCERFAALGGDAHRLEAVPGTVVIFGNTTCC